MQEEIAIQSEGEVKYN